MSIIMKWRKIFRRIRATPPLYSAGIIMQLDKFASEMQIETQITNKSRKFGMIAGVVSLADPLFFSVEYLNSKSMFPLFYKFNIITSDDYLDYLNLNKSNYGNDTDTKTPN